jgi:hypothetical protein
MVPLSHLRHEKKKTHPGLFCPATVKGIHAMPTPDTGSGRFELDEIFSRLQNLPRATLKAIDYKEIMSRIIKLIIPAKRTF